MSFPKDFAYKRKGGYLVPPTREQCRKWKIAPPKEGEVVCLGPTEEEHAFWSPDIRRIRLCEKCRTVIRRKGGGGLDE